MSETLVKIEDVSKKYCRDLKTSLWYGVKDIASELICRKSKPQLRGKEFWALQDVNFELKRGESLGIIGPNGAGKSTLLKILTGLIKPDTGKIIMKGRIQALIELGAGFNPVLTGRENIYINAAVLGIPKKVIDKKLEEIIEFAELEGFIDTPVQSYSSGMKVKLGFAIAVNVEPDVLIIDEVLAVGDLGFQNKAMKKMAETREKAGVVIFVSHSMAAVRSVCNKGLLLAPGIKPVKKNVTEAITDYYQINANNSNKNIISTGELILQDWYTTSGTHNVSFNTPIDLIFEVLAQKNYEDVDITTGLTDKNNMIVVGFNTTDRGIECNRKLIKGLNKIKVSFGSCLFANGQYFPQLSIRSKASGATLLRINSHKALSVNGSKTGLGIIDGEFNLEFVN